MSDDDVALMLAFAAGEEDAFVELYRRYRDRIVNFAARMLGDRARGEEAAQDVFLKLYRTRDTYKPQSRFSTFVYRIATNHCLNQRSRVEHRVITAGADVEDAVADSVDQERELVNRELQTALSDALARLPDRQRAALLLVHYDGFSYREAADALAVSQAAVKSLIHRSRAAMSTELAQWFEPSAEVEYAV
ncbi:MAG TPA: RNA polymerase sigma factor [Polyangiales bacterium]|nr:RNA polymerase sigma factor [Polyangiales bacterium]